MSGPGLRSSYLGRMIKSATLANQATEQNNAIPSNIYCQFVNVNHVTLRQLHMISINRLDT